SVAFGNTQQFNGPINGAAYKRPVGFSAIVDGLSNTAAFSERVKGIGSINAIDPLRPSSTIVSTTFTSPFSPSGDQKVCLATPPIPTATIDTQAAGPGADWTRCFTFS